MKASDEHRLLREILADNATETLRETSLAGGLAALRARRRRRSAVSGIAAAAAIVAVIGLLSSQRSDPRVSLPQVPTSARSKPVELIDDQQLLALFPDRSLALIGPPGRQSLIFLDSAEPADRSARTH